MRLLLSLILICIVFHGNSQIPEKDWQITTASLAAPEAFRNDVTVLGYDPSGKLVTLKEGTNDIICLADDPENDGFSVAAYHKEMEPYMARGRELKAEGKGFKERFDIREEEVKAGKIKLPERSTLYVLTGTVNPETMEVEDQYLRYVVYIPYATSESTGLPLSPPGPGGPWIMDPGTHRAHIMINPPRN